MQGTVSYVTHDVVAVKIASNEMHCLPNLPAVHMHAFRGDENANDHGQLIKVEVDKAGKLDNSDVVVSVFKESKVEWGGSKPNFWRQKVQAQVVDAGTASARSCPRKWKKLNERPRDGVEIFSNALVGKLRERLLEYLAFGSRWKCIGPMKPSQGTELTNSELSKVLGEKTTFTAAEREKLGITDVRKGHYIKGVAAYFEPVDPESDGDAPDSTDMEPFMFEYEEWKKLNVTAHIDEDLGVVFKDDFVQVDATIKGSDVATFFQAVHYDETYLPTNDAHLPTNDVHKKLGTWTDGWTKPRMIQQVTDREVRLDGACRVENPTWVENPTSERREAISDDDKNQVVTFDERTVIVHNVARTLEVQPKFYSYTTCVLTTELT